MKTYMLTDTGKRLARSVNNPDTANWRVIHALDPANGIGSGTPEQIAAYSHLSEGQAIGALAILKGKQIVQEV